MPKLALGSFVVSCAVVVLAGCASAPSAPPPRSVAEISADYRAELESLSDRAGREIFWIDCATPSRHPQSNCGLLADTFFAPTAIANFQREGCNEDAGAAVSEACAQKLVEVFRARLGVRYARATAAATEHQCAKTGLDCSSKLRHLEVGMLLAHDELTFAKLEADSRDVLVRQRAALEARQAAVDARDQEEARADARRRAIAAGIAAGLQGFGAGANATPAYSPPPLYTPPAPVLVSNSCSSDYDCGSGRACVKGEMQMRGVCATTVNRYGTQTYEPPRPNVGPGTRGDCRFDTDCTVGWRCEKGGGISGTCLRPR